jgi:hypothetical protein
MLPTRRVCARVCVSAWGLYRARVRVRVGGGGPARARDDAGCFLRLLKAQLSTLAPKVDTYIDTYVHLS